MANDKQKKKKSAVHRGMKNNQNCRDWFSSVGLQIYLQLNWCSVLFKKRIEHTVCQL